MNKKVLIVDNEDTVRQLIRVTLRAYEVIEGSDGVEALEKARREKPDLILLDLMMPKMNGFEVIKRLKSDPTVAEIPIILLTARGDQDSLEQGLEAGVLTYLTKPFSPRKLAKQVEKILMEKSTNSKPADDT